jgi:hypothetical protein
LNTTTAIPKEPITLSVRGKRGTGKYVCPTAGM